MLRAVIASLGNVVEHEQVVQLPLNGRAFIMLAALAPGVALGPSVGSWFCGRYAAPMSTALRSTAPFAPPWNARSRLKP